MRFLHYCSCHNDLHLELRLMYVQCMFKVYRIIVQCVKRYVDKCLTYIGHLDRMSSFMSFI